MAQPPSDGLTAEIFPVLQKSLASLGSRSKIKRCSVDLPHRKHYDSRAAPALCSAPVARSAEHHGAPSAFTKSSERAPPGGAPLPERSECSAPRSRSRSALSGAPKDRAPSFGARSAGDPLREGQVARGSSLSAESGRLAVASGWRSVVSV
jgi:hypothetical protein